MSLILKALVLARAAKRAAIPALILSLLCTPAHSFNWWHHHHAAPQLVIDGHAVLFTVVPTMGRDRVVTAPVDFVHVLGADYTVGSGGDTLTVTGSGRSFEVPYTRTDDRCIVNVVQVAQDLGAECDWNGHSSTLTLRAKVLGERITNGKLTISTSYPVNYATGALSNPSRIYVDLTGAMIAGPQAVIPINGNGVQKLRYKQLDFNTVRVVLNMTHVARVAPAPNDKQSTIQVSLNATPFDMRTPSILSRIASGAHENSTLTDTGVPVQSPPTPVVRQAEPRAPISPVTSQPSEPAGGSDARVTGISTQTNTDGKLQVIVLSTGQIADPIITNTFDRTADKPDRFALDIPASLALTGTLGSGPLAVKDPEITSVRWGTIHTNGKAFTRIVLDLASPESYHVTSEAAPSGEGTIYTIEPGSSAPPSEAIVVPGNAAPGGDMPSIAHGDGSVKGMLIVVDPGHGGKDTGAPGADGLYEKNLTLAIGKDLRDALVGAGANVIMTREDDTFIPLSTRSQIAIDNQANYFISIHCDSGSGRNAQEGSTVYYHGNNTTCRTLAMCIASRFNEANLGIRSDGVRTDYVRFPGSGFSVLRRAGEPAVLCECGYVNNDADARKLTDPDEQKMIAASIVAGLKDFVGNKVASR